MAAPIAADVRLPDDSGNTGKRVRTQSRVVNGSTVHEHYFVPISSRSITGIYKFSTGVLNVQVSAHDGTGTGHFWLLNPIGSTILMSLRRFEFQFGMAANTTTTTLPRTVLSQFTFSGSPTGASITPARRRYATPADAAPQGSLRTASTNITVTLRATQPSGVEYTVLPQSMVGTAGWTFIPPAMLEYELRDEDAETILAPGEGVVLWQPDNGGATTDVRRLICNGSWTEFEV